MADDPIYYVPDGSPRLVYRRPVTTEEGTVMGFRVCETDEYIDGAAEEIAHALNELPKVQLLLIEAAQALREAVNHIGEPYTTKEGKPYKEAAEATAAKIEDWMTA